MKRLFILYFALLIVSAIAEEKESLPQDNSEVIKTKDDSEALCKVYSRGRHTGKRLVRP